MNKKKTALKPRGLRNNNPLNIRHSADTFRGEVEGTDRAFKTFSYMSYGYRAAFVILGTYLSRGLNTIEKIISRWAPPSENNTFDYVEIVELLSDVPRDKVLTATDGADYIQIVAAMSFVENETAPDFSQVESGFRLQTKIKNL